VSFLVGVSQKIINTPSYQKFRVLPYKRFHAQNTHKAAFPPTLRVELRCERRWKRRFNVGEHANKMRSRIGNIPWEFQISD